MSNVASQWWVIVKLSLRWPFVNFKKTKTQRHIWIGLQTHCKLMQSLVKNASFEYSVLYTGCMNDVISHFLAGVIMSLSFELVPEGRTETEGILLRWQHNVSLRYGGLPLLESKTQCTYSMILFLCKLIMFIKTPSLQQSYLCYLMNTLGQQLLDNS